MPRAERGVVEAAVRAAVKEGKLWLTSGPASVLAEEIPAGLLTDDARLEAPPPPIPATDILPANLAEVWGEKTTTALAISVALSNKAGKNLPWATVREAIDGAFHAQMLERTLDSGLWPCDYAGAATVKLTLPATKEAGLKEPPLSLKPGVLSAESDLRPGQIQDLAEKIAEITRQAVGLDLKFRLRIELGGAQPPPNDVVTKLNQILKEIADNLRLG